MTLTQHGKGKDPGPLYPSTLACRHRRGNPYLTFPSQRSVNSVATSAFNRGRGVRVPLLFLGSLPFRGLPRRSRGSGDLEGLSPAPIGTDTGVPFLRNVCPHSSSEIVHLRDHSGVSMYQTGWTWFCSPSLESMTKVVFL